jgi:TrmH family RNA methyltransferase
MFHLPIPVAAELGEAVDAARAAGLQVLGADGAGNRTIDQLGAAGQLTRPTMWVLGNEAWGLPPDRAALVDDLVALPMYGRAESLNLSTAAAVFLYATATAQH